MLILNYSAASLIGNSSSMVLTRAKKSALNLFNFSFLSDNTLVSITPYFRNYLFSRRDAGFGLIGPLFSYRHISKSSKWRLRFFKSWTFNGQIYSHKTIRRSIAPQSLFMVNRFTLPFFKKFMKSINNPQNPQWLPSVAHFLSFSVNRLWLTQVCRMKTLAISGTLGLLRNLFFKNWLLTLYGFDKLLSKFIYTVYTRTAFSMPRQFLSIGLDSGSFSPLGAKRFVYGSWHARYSKQTKFYKRKRLMVTRYARFLFGVRRTRFVKKICQGVPHSAIDRIHTFNVMFHTRLVTFISLFFKIRSHIRILLLIKTGHIFVNGQCIRNPDFSLKTHDTISFSTISQKWIKTLQGRKTRRFRFIRIRKRRFLVGKWKPRVFSRKFEKSVIFGPFCQFAVIRHVSALPIRPFRRKFGSIPFFSKNRVRFLLGTLSF